MSDGTQIALLLRFRDLVNPEGGSTIREHQNIIKEHGYVWWAWWKKQSELVPVELWGKIQPRAGSGPVSTYLVDSGQRKLYKSSIHALHLDFDGTPVPAPESGQRTPGYYSQQLFTTWFKLGPIEEISPDTLRDLAYERAPDDDLVRVEEDLFVGHRIDGINQLLEFGNVTYWVAAPAAPGSGVARGPRKRYPIPIIAPRDAITAQEPRILHISDLHVAQGYHAFALQSANAFNKSLATALHQALQAHPPGVVVVSGDLTWTGSSKEFADAFDCLEALRSALGLKHDDFIIVPGNHDVRWTKAQRDNGQYDPVEPVELPLDQVEPTVAVAQENYRAFFQKWYGRQPNKFLSVGRRFFMVGGPTVDVLGVNSTALQQIEGTFAGVGWVGEALADSAKEMGWTRDETRGRRATDVRLLVLHHHLVPVAMQEQPVDARRGFGVVLDAGKILQEASRFGVDLVLHGHQHQPFVSHTWCEAIVGTPIQAPRPLLVTGCGSTGVASEHLGPIQQRCFNLIELRRSQVALDLYATPQEPHTFERTATVTAEWGSHWQRGVIQ